MVARFIRRAIFVLPTCLYMPYVSLTRCSLAASIACRSNMPIAPPKKKQKKKQYNQWSERRVISKCFRLVHGVSTGVYMIKFLNMPAGYCVGCSVGRRPEYTLAQPSFVNIFDIYTIFFHFFSFNLHNQTHLLLTFINMVCLHMVQLAFPHQKYSESKLLSLTSNTHLTFSFSSSLKTIAYATCSSTFQHLHSCLRK